MAITLVCICMYTLVCLCFLFTRFIVE